MKWAEVQRFFTEVKVEAKKVTWPAPAEAMQATIGVVVMVLLVALFLWGVDSLISWVIRKVMMG